MTFTIVREAFKEIKLKLLREIKQVQDSSEIPILIWFRLLSMKVYSIINLLLREWKKTVISLVLRSVITKCLTWLKLNQKSFLFLSIS